MTKELVGIKYLKRDNQYSDQDDIMPQSQNREEHLKQIITETRNGNISKRCFIKLMSWSGISLAAALSLLDFSPTVFGADFPIRKSNPLILLGQMDVMLRQGGKLLIASPFTWNRDICPESRWLENPETPPLKILKELLAGVRMLENDFHYHIVNEKLNIPWVLPLSDNQITLFKTQMILAKKR